MHISWITFIIPQDMAFQNQTRPYPFTLKKKTPEMAVLASRTGKRNVLQFDVCCKGTDQNFNCGCDRYTILHSYIVLTHYYQVAKIDCSLF